MRRLIDAVEGEGGLVKRANTLEPNLEDVFLHLTGTEMRVEISESVSTSGGHGPGAIPRTKRIR